MSDIKELDPIIDVDGTKYSITAAKTLNGLTIQEGLAENAPSFTFNGNEAKTISIPTEEDITSVINEASIVDSDLGATTIKVGGIEVGTSFKENTSIKDVLQMMLYPYVPFTFNGITLYEAAGTFEYGTPKNITSVTPTFTKGSKNITSIKVGTTSGGDDLFSGSSAASGSAIPLTTSKAFDGDTGGTIYCTISDGSTTDTKSAKVSYTYYNYIAVTSSTNIPTSAEAAKNNGTSAEATITTTDNTYIWFLMPNQNKKTIQQYAMNQWNNMNTTYAGTVEFTTSTGKQVTYYAYRTDAMLTASEKYRIN